MNHILRSTNVFVMETWRPLRTLVSSSILSLLLSGMTFLRSVVTISMVALVCPTQEATAVRTVTTEDLKLILKHIIESNHEPGALPDDIDHLGFRRVRYFGEMLAAACACGYDSHEAKYSGSYVYHRS
jgi:DNA-directed RNA polymerase beta subunit